MSVSWVMVLWQIVIVFVPVAVLFLLSIYTLLLAIKALRIYIRKNS
jgi:hypothetical protein